MKLSVVIPVYNGAKTIAAVVGAVCHELGDLSPEIVLVNDGSGDNSHDVCLHLAEQFPGIKYISLRKNFGEHNAVMCGLRFCEGDFVAVIDDDLQNEPREIRTLLRRAEEGIDVVYAQYVTKKHSWYRNTGSRFTNWVATFLLKKPAELYLSSFKVMRREVVKELIKYTGPFPYVDGLIFRVTRSVSSVAVAHQARASGQSNYTLKKLVSLYLNMFLNFSILPLRLFTLGGIGAVAAGVGLACITILEHVLGGTVPVGYTTLVSLMVVFGGIQLLFIGLVGEYIGKHYLDFNGTPQWVIREAVNLTVGTTTPRG